MNYNRTILGGRLTRDPETRFLNNGTAVVSFGLAVNEKIDKSKERVLFVDVTIFGKRGEAFAKYHKKGGETLIEGKLRLDSWDDRTTGQKRTKLYVVADSWEFAGGKQSAEPREDNDDDYDANACFKEYEKAHPKVTSESDDDAPF